MKGILKGLFSSESTGREEFLNNRKRVYGKATVVIEIH